jgi:Domain of unknown function (DUF4760)
MNNFQNPDEIGRFNLPIVVGFASMSVVMAVLLTSGFAFYNNKDDTKAAKNFEVAINTFAMAAAISSAAYGFQGIRQGAKQQESTHRVDITREYINLWDEEQFANARVTIRELLQTLNGTADRAEKLRDQLRQSPRAKQDITLILNLLEKIAIFWQADLLHEPLLRKFYRPIVLQCWEVLRIYVADRRNEVNGEIYESIEALHRYWSSSSYQDSLRKRGENT